MKNPADWSSKEARQLRKLRSPDRIQNFLNSIPYHHANTAWSPRRVLLEKTAHCLEGAIFAAAALRFHGYQPLLLDLEAEQDSDHVLAVYKKGNCWGSVATSNFAGLRGRSPVYLSIRELAMSYFEVYFNLRGELSLRNVSRPVNLAKFDHLNWMTTEKQVWFIPEFLVTIPHTPLISSRQVASLKRVDGRALGAAKFGRTLKPAL